MADIPSESSLSRPSLAQVKAVVEFMEKHPELANSNLRTGKSREKIRNLWIQLSSTANSLNGAMKSTKDWIRFWADRKRTVLTKQKEINSGYIRDRLTPIEQKILNMCPKEKKTRRRKLVKRETKSNYKNDSSDDSLCMNGDDMELHSSDSKTNCTETEDRQISILEKMIEAMDQQAAAMVQIVQASVRNSKAMEQIAEATHKQALAVDKLATTFETVNTSVYDVRNAVMSIDYTVKRCYPSSQVSQNTNLFS